MNYKVVDIIGVYNFNIKLICHPNSYELIIIFFENNSPRLEKFQVATSHLPPIKLQVATIAPTSEFYLTVVVMIRFDVYFLKLVGKIINILLLSQSVQYKLQYSTPFLHSSRIESTSVVYK